MIERSNFSTIDLKKSEPKQSSTRNGKATFTIAATRSYKSGFEKDGSQIIPRKNKIVSTRPRPALHLPKNERKLKASTVKDLLQKQQKLRESQIGSSGRARRSPKMRKSMIPERSPDNLRDIQLT